MKKYILLLFAVMFLVGCGNTVEVDGAKVTYEELQESIEELMQEENEYIEKLTEQIEVYENNKKRFDELEELDKNRKTIEKELDEQGSKLKEIESSIKEKEEQLKVLEGEIVNIKDGPIKINAGYFYFGTDIEPGRYVVKPQGNRSGNFFVRGTKRVNIILGNEHDSHVGEFTFEAFDGDELETKIPVELYPVE